MACSGSTESLSQHVGNFLRKELKAQGLSQSTFAEQLNVDPRTVRRWLSGEMHSLDGLQEIATALHIRVRDIISDWDDVPFPISMCCYQYKSGASCPACEIILNCESAQI